MKNDLAFLFEEDKEEEEQNKKIDPALSFLFDSEEETPSTVSAPVDSDISWLFEDKPTTTQDTDEPTFARKFDYGLEQEQTILGNLWQNSVAGFRSLTAEGMSFEEALKQVEKERQEEIFEKYPEFRNRPEDAAVISGRISKANLI